ncbi:uncharacterized protein PFL1_03476 [Pseudozyma flocculosa PF-1]|uniref:Uncharacterized protein n=1 Tax=Pseudozyma flocculosa PF-1 TaxID=1277687 RepID=A0A061H9Q8_9BASI|nr:uncharacterized protein PFL1_03476 [Pseudozyma flocculosa PF-1]EPQ29189.1 hypothetical protein PFL1_03476 [Pseudozyma flocculosa PF-1]
MVGTAHSSTGDPADRASDAPASHLSALERQRLQDLTQFISQHVAALTDSFIQSLINLCKVMRSSKRNDSMLEIAKAGVRVAFEFWVQDSLSPEFDAYLPISIRSLLRSTGVRRLSDDAQEIYKIILPQLSAEFQSSPHVSIAALLLRLLVEGATQRSPPRIFFPGNLVERDFHSDFRGGGDWQLCQHIETLQKTFDRTKHYCRTVPIIQSSGSGKSRTVDQVLRKHHLGIMIFEEPAKPIKAILDKDEKAKAIPQTQEDKEKAKHARNKALRVWRKNRNRMLAWFEAFAHIFAEEVTAAKAAYEPSPLSDGRPSFVEEFYEHLQLELPSSPTDFASRGGPDPSPRRQALLQAIARRYASNIEALDEDSDSSADAYQAGPCAQAFADLQAATVAAYAGGPRRDSGVFILALDEAMGLGDLLPHIRRLWHRIHEPPSNADRLVLLVLDTNSSVHYLVGQGAM